MTMIEWDRSREGQRRRERLRARTAAVLAWRMLRKYVRAYGTVAWPHAASDLRAAIGLLTDDQKYAARAAALLVIEVIEGKRRTS